MLHIRPHRCLGFLHRLDHLFLRAFGHGFEEPSFAGNLPINLPFQRHDLRAFLHTGVTLSLIHISEPTRLGMISYAVFCLKKKKKKIKKKKQKKKQKKNNKKKKKKKIKK